MGGGKPVVDLTELTASGILCLDELVQIAALLNKTEVAPDWLVVTCVTCVESHFDRVLRTLIAASQVSENRFLNSIYESIQDDIFKTWDSRFKWLDDGFGVAISSDRSIQNFRTMVDLRNAIVHGRGHLTGVQQKNFLKLLDLKRRLMHLLDVQFTGLRLLIPSNVGAKVIEICREATVFIDKSVRQAHPTIDV